MLVSFSLGKHLSGDEEFETSLSTTEWIHSSVEVITDYTDSIALLDEFANLAFIQAGVVLSELLWIRCGFTLAQGRILSSFEQTLGAADLLLQSGGFGLLVLDLGNVPDKAVRQILLTTWFRVRRGVEETQTLFVVLGKQSSAGTSSANVLDLSQSGIDIEENAISSKHQHIDGN
jgi:hypothetical protein